MATTSTTAQATTALRSAGPAALRYGRSVGVGAAFAIGWTPCIGPILGAVLTMAASSAQALQGTLLLLAWSLGLGVPFLLAGFALGTAMRTIRKLRPVMPVLEITGGILVIIIGSLIFLDRFTIFNQYFTGGVSNVTSAEDGLSGIDVAGAFGFAAAFSAGVIAFLSPCCLPMVPAYLAHLAGVSADAAAHEQRGVTFRHSLSFVAGFTIVFVVLGASAGAVGSFLQGHLDTLERIAGVFLIAMGLHLIGILRIPWLYRTYQVEFPDARTPERVTAEAEANPPAG
jgi:cytochrome c biogenesis protein CcdA